jgi:CubicO group peptidase (beta-lactamase class C family)
MSDASGTTPADTFIAALAPIDAWQVPHAGVVVVGPDGPLAHRGETERILPVASLAKPLTAATVLLEVAAGSLDLDEPAGPTADQGATLRHLLAHAAGLGFEHGDRTMAPGARRIYSNWGYEAAAELAAERAGTSFADLMRERLTGPLGMTSTTLDGSPAHAVTSTVEDLARFVTELVAPRVLDAQTHALLTTPAFPELDGVLPGFGRQRPERLDARPGGARDEGAALVGRAALPRRRRPLRSHRLAAVGRLCRRGRARDAVRRRLRRLGAHRVARTQRRRHRRGAGSGQRGLNRSAITGRERGERHRAVADRVLLRRGELTVRAPVVRSRPR